MCLQEIDQLRAQLYEERQRRERLEAELRRLREQQTPAPPPAKSPDALRKFIDTGAALRYAV
jgi:type II secretory pathway component PulM